MSGLCLGITMAVLTLGASAASAQGDDQSGEVRPTHSNLCLGVAGGSTVAGAAVTQQNCTEAEHQRWTQVDIGGGYTQLRVGHTGMCLNVEGGSTANLARLIQWQCSNGTNDDFSVTAGSQSGTVHLTARHSGKCVDIDSGSTAAGAAAIQYSCHYGTNQTFRIDEATVDADQGSWGPVRTLPLVPVAGSALPDGRILMWASSRGFSIGPDAYTEAVIYNPADGAISRQTVSSTGHDMFCPGIAHLSDGRILINGGSSSAETTIYNPSTGQWENADDMNTGRGYNGSTLLADGSALTVGGSWSGGQGNKGAEVYDDETGWRRLAGISAETLAGPDPAGIYRADNHMWLFGWTDDRVFHAGPSRQTHWLDTTGQGSVTNAGNRGSDGYAMNGNAVMYDIGKILAVGGAPAYENAWGTTNATVIDISSGSASARTVAPMANRRTLASAVVLPNGEVVVTGGQQYAKLFTDERAIMTTEIWNPDTEQFRAAAPISVPRTYHSFSLLLPDGRVVTGGGGLCGGCATNHPDIQIFTPPYLLNPDGSAAQRPSITSAPAAVDQGERFEVRTGGAVAEFSLVRMGSATHTVNNDQRRIPLPKSGADGSYTLSMPSEAGVAIPGLYMLFALDSNGVPSQARIVRVTTTVTSTGPATIGGSVTDSSGPVAGVSVDLFTEGRATYLESTTTDGSGHYSFEVDPGCYVVTFIAPDGRQFAGGRYSNVAGCVASSETNDDLDASLIDTGSEAGVEGRTRTSGGSSMAGVQVDLFTEGRTSYLRSTSTGADGTYRFDLDPGCYVVTFIAPDGSLFTNGTRWLNRGFCANTTETVTGVDATIVSSGGLADAVGTVTRGGSGVAGVDVDLFTATDTGGRNTFLRSDITDGAGRFGFEVAAGCYVFTFKAPDGTQWVETGSIWYNAGFCANEGETATTNAHLQ